MKLMPEAFTDTAREWPDRVAVQAGGNSLTFGELDRLTRSLADRLRAAGAAPDTIIGVLVPRTSALIVAMLGVWRAGAAFVLLDPAEPRQRLEYLLDTADVTAVVGDSSLLAQWTGHGVPLVPVDALQSTEALSLPPTESHHLAYLVFTSGSTGRPKGVLIEHGSLAEHAQTQLMPIYRSVAGTRDDQLRVGGAAPLTFDSFIDQFLPMVADGHTLVLLDEESRLNFSSYLTGLDVVDCTPALLALLVDQGLLSPPARPRLIIFGGEKPSQRLWDALRADDVRAVSVYGATECTVSSMEAEPCHYPQVTLGLVTGSARVHVLDERLQPVAPGETGEIYLAGPGIARGYLANPAATAAAFLPDPFSASPRARMYRTGDLGRLTADGRLDFHGRADDQLKIRGFRIEPGEIEAVLEEHPGVRRAVVTPVLLNGAADHLIAYVECAPDAVPTRADLQERLPAHLVPSAIVAVRELPLTRNGKIDRAACADLAPAPVVEGGQQPADALEQQVLDIWEAAFDRTGIGVTDDFAALGGHSLLSLSIAARISTELSVTAPPDRLIVAPTVREMATLLRSSYEIVGHEG